MKFSRFILFASAFAIFLSVCSWAQQNSAPSSGLVTNDFVQKAFGKDCTINPGSQVQVADFDGDGVDDIVIPARCTNPMIDATEHNYTVIDPANAFYGISDPHITTQFSTLQPEQRSLALLIIHGAGKEAWKSNTPKAKFLIVNLAYKHIDVRKFQLNKKKVEEAVYVEELGEDQMTSVILWDGKKYKYEPLGSVTE
jgi:hypothetical protein